MFVCTQLEGRGGVDQRFQMTIYRGTVLLPLKGHVLMLFTSDPRRFTSGAGFFQSRPKENYQRGLSDLSACSSWRLGFLTNSSGPDLQNQGEGGLLPRLASDSLLLCQVTVKSHQPADFSCFCSPLNPQVYMLYFILFIMYICLCLSSVTKTLF